MENRQTQCDSLTGEMLTTLGRLTAEVASMNNRSSILQHIANSIASTFTTPDDVFVSIIYKGISFTNGQPAASETRISVPVSVAGEVKGSIKVSYNQYCNNISTKSWQLFIENIATLISTQIMRLKYANLRQQNYQRSKELDAINHTSQIIKHGLPIDQTLQEICSMLPRAWVHSDWAVARIKFQDKQYTSLNFAVTQWGMDEQFSTFDNKKGSIEIYYQREFEEDNGTPFLPEERNLLTNIARLITGYLNSFKGSEIILQKAGRTAVSGS